MRQKTNKETNKPVWILQTKEGKFIDRFRSKMIAEKTKKYYKEKYWIETEIVKDNSYVENLKRLIK